MLHYVITCLLAIKLELWSVDISLRCMNYIVTVHTIGVMRTAHECLHN